jgi:DNA-binding NarL/FixJ family response regulator
MKIIICDDQAIIRDGLELLIKLEKDMDVIGLAQDGSEAVEMTASLNPDLVLMDLKMPGMNGVEATRRIIRDHPEVKVLVLTTYNDDEWVFDAIKAGASGYLLKDTPREKVIEAIRGTLSGKAFIDPVVTKKIIEEIANQNIKSSTIITEKLTPREIEILQLLCHGFSNQEISNRIFLSEGTVRNHISSILFKLGVSDRTQAVVIALQHGLGK